MEAGIKTVVKRVEVLGRPSGRESLRKMEEGFRRLIDQSPDPVFICCDQRIVYANDAAVELMDAPGKSLIIGTSVCDLFQGECLERTLHQLHLIEAGQAGSMTEGKLVAMNGQGKEIEWMGTLVHFHSRRAVHILVRDLTETKATQEMLRNSEKLSLAGQLAAGIAHEIRNPLTSLKGFLQLIQAEGNGKREYFRIMSSELNRIEGIVSELLSLAKPASTTIFKECNLVDLLSHVVTLLEPKAILGNVSLTPVYETESAVIRGDENQLKQAFINFLKNGIEAMPDGGELCIRLSRREPGGFSISFIDEGVGISPAQLEKLGQPFYTTKPCGTGLGLMMSHKIIEQHCGRIQIVSERSHGTTVTVELPAHP